MAAGCPVVERTRAELVNPDNLKMFKIKKLIFVLTLFTLTCAWIGVGCTSNKSRFTGPTSTEDPLPPALIADLEAYVQKVMKRNDVPGLAMVLVHGGQIVYNQGFGVRDLGTRETVTTETLFGIGSSTKPMTAVMIASLVDEGLVAWDTKATEILPDFALSNPSATEKVTLEHTLCMCTGVPRQMEEISVQYDEVTPEDILESLAEIPLSGAFGNRFNYSSRMLAAGGYLAALAVGSTYGQLGQGYANLMQEQLLDPLGMTASTFSIEEAIVSGNYATPHYSSLSGLEAIPPEIEGIFTPIAPAGAMWSNTEDMAKFLVTMLNGGVAPNGERVVSELNLAYLWEPRVAVDDTIQYGLGWHVEDYHGLTIYHHPGGTVGFSAELVVIPELKVGFALLTNQLDQVAPTGRMATYRLLEMLTGEEQVYDQEIRAATRSIRWQVFQLSLVTRKKVNPQRITPFLGTYHNEILGKVDLRLHEDNTLWVDFGEYESSVRPLILEDNQYIFFESVFIGKLITLNMDANENPRMRWAGDEATYYFTR
jgi:CubicO group peptidase (beta-lactamase class C family)